MVCSVKEFIELTVISRLFCYSVTSLHCYRLTKSFIKTFTQNSECNASEQLLVMVFVYWMAFPSKLLLWCLIPIVDIRTDSKRTIRSVIEIMTTRSIYIYILTGLPYNFTLCFFLILLTNCIFYWCLSLKVCKRVAYNDQNLTKEEIRKTLNNYCIKRLQNYLFWLNTDVIKELMIRLLYKMNVVFN